MALERVAPGPGQESVWDYPRPPRLERSPRRVRIEHGGVVVADTRRALRVLETSHPPTYYVPREDIDPSCLRPTEGSSFCEWKGRAAYLDVVVGGTIAHEAGWYYPEPTEGFAALRDHVAFYPGRLDRCTVDDEVVAPQAGGFYGGWVTRDVVGPFKGAPGTAGW
jgi:uncharacterized protein (DUF427 family)